MSQLNREWRIIWLLRISTFCIRIVEKACGITCQIYGSISHPISTYQSSSRKMTYNFYSRITRWLSTFRQRIAEGHALLNMSRVQQTVYRPTYFKYTDFSTTYHRSAQLAKKGLPGIISKAIKIQRGTQKIPFIGEKSDMGEYSSTVTAVHASSGASK